MTCHRTPFALIPTAGTDSHVHWATADWMMYVEAGPRHHQIGLFNNYSIEKKNIKSTQIELIVTSKINWTTTT